MSSAPSPAPLLRLRVSPVAERFIRSQHPWVYSDSITDASREGDVGDMAVVYDRKDKFLALGLFDPLSPIRLRVLHAGKPVRADQDWWLNRVRAAKERRSGLFDEAQTNAWRWISGESDGFPGLVLDRYDHTLVLKLYSAVWLPRLEEVVRWIQEVFQPVSLVLRLSRNIQEVARQRWNVAEGCIAGPVPDDVVVFRENGISFEAEVMRGQKTGFYLDQRDNRARVQALAEGRDVLNVFSFSGGFSLYAARGGARSVTDVDISKHALDSARRNFALNPALSQVPHHCVQADAFDWLAGHEGERYDLIVCDPPSLARRETDRAGAVGAYRSLVQGCLRHLAPGGILVAASCSAHVSEEEFFGAVTDAATARAVWTELWRTRHAPDHPATFPEAQYLKCMALRVERFLR